MSDDAFQEWLRSRPESVQQLAKEFPIGIARIVNGEMLYLLGYTESDMLIMSRHDPSKEWDASIKHKVYICAGHLRHAGWPR